MVVPDKPTIELPKRLSLKGILFIPLLMFVICGCVKQDSRVISERSFLIMGTVCDIKVSCPGVEKGRQALDIIQGSLKRSEAEYNFHDESSRLSFINRQAEKGFVELSDEEAFLIKKAVYFSTLTSGAFDVTFEPLWDLWKKCEKEGRLPEKDEIISAKSRFGYKHLIFSSDGRSLRFDLKGLRINLGGMAKGMALLDCRDKVLSHGFDNLLVSLGGDILALGEGRGGGWVIGIQDPESSSMIKTRIKVRDKLVLTSGIYQRYLVINGKKYHHIINANTGFPASDFSGVTLIMDAGRDKYVPSLAVFLMGREAAMRFLGPNKDLGYFIVGTDGEVAKRIPGEEVKEGREE